MAMDLDVVLALFFFGATRVQLFCCSGDFTKVCDKDSYEEVSFLKGPAFQVGGCAYFNQRLSAVMYIYI